MTWYEIFPRILNMSLTASVIIVFVLIIRLLLKKASKIYSYVLWSVVLFRLLCPVSLSAPVSILGIFDAPVIENTADIGKTNPVTTSSLEYIPSNIVHEEYPEITLPIPAGDDAINDAVNERMPQGWVQTTFDPLEAPVTIATYLWMIGILCLFSYGIVSYFRLRQKLVGALQLHDNIYLADHIRSPFVMGIVRPRIYLPSDLEKQEQEYIILHEQHHIRRGDPVLKMLAFLALCIHWFNPFVWAAFVLSAKDMEMSCDEAVVKKLGEEIRADYSASLLHLATGRRILFGTPLAFGEGEPSGRIRNLARFRRPTILVTLIAVLVCVAGILLCVFNPAASYDSLKMIEQDGTVGGNLVKYEVELGTRVGSALIYAEQWSNGTCTSVAPLTLSQDVEELQILMKERKSEGKLTGIDIQIDSDEAGGSLLTYFAFPEGHSVMGWSFNAYKKDEKLEVHPGEEIILAAMVFDEGNGVRVFDCETLVSEPERLENAGQMMVIRAAFQEEVLGNVIEGSATLPVEVLQLQQVIELSRKEYDLSWNDFENFDHTETGSGLYIRVYEIDETFTLMIGGSSLDQEPMYIYLTAGEDEENRIDIRDGGVEEFIKANTEKDSQDTERVASDDELLIGDVVLTSQPAADKVSIRVQPSVLRNYVSYYYTPEGEDQQWLQDYLNTLSMEGEAYSRQWGGMKETGWQIAWKDKQFMVFEGGYLYYSYRDESQGMMEIFVEEPKLCDYIQIMLQEKIEYHSYEPKDIRDIVSAKLEVQSFSTNWEYYSQTITEKAVLEKMENWFGNGRYQFGGAECDNEKCCLELNLQSGEAVRINVATDSCAIFGINGVYYDYQPASGWDNREFFELFDEVPWNWMEEQEESSTLGEAGELLYRENVNGVGMEDGMEVLISSAVIEGAVSEPAVLLEEDAMFISSLLEESTWNDGATTDCLSDLLINIGAEEIYYHSDCGTFNDYKNERFISLSEETQEKVDGVLKKYMRMGAVNMPAEESTETGR